ncbi:MAG: hypothetical protein ACKO48_07560 [Actinomycetota bacterium]
MAANVLAVGRNLRVEVSAPKGALVHIYRDGKLVRSVTPEEAKSLTIPAGNSSGASAEDAVQIVVVTRTGEVLSTPVPAGEQGGATGGRGDTPAEQGGATGGEVTPTTAAARAGAGSGATAKPGANAKPGATAKPGTQSGGKSSSGKAGQRSTTDTVKPRN